MRRFAVGFGRFWYDFVVGDDWRVAVGVVAVLVAGAVLVAAQAVPDDVLAPLLGAAVVVIVGASVVVTARSSRRG